MKTLYLECGMGAAGDMLMAALLELIPDRQAFIDKMNALGLPGVRVEAEQAVKCGITGTHMKVTVNGQEEESLDAHAHHHDHEHEHHHDHDHGCACGHDHHGHHHADEVFDNIGVETPKRFEEAEVRKALEALDEGNGFEYGNILRAKGILPTTDGRWLHFDYVPDEVDVRYGSADYTGRLCVIGCNLKESAIKELFGV